VHPDRACGAAGPSRVRREGAEPAPSASEARSPPAAAPVAAAPPPAPAVVESSGLAIPDPDEWDIPIVCFRCGGEYAVAFRYFRAGVVFSCPHCNGSFVPTLSMVRGVEEALARFHGRWTKAFETLQERRRRQLEQFEDRQRAEIGAVRVAGGRLLESFVTLVNPGRPIPPFVSNLTGITDAMVAAAPPLEEALPRFVQFLGEGVLVAHDASFDVAHLNAAHRAWA